MDVLYHCEFGNKHLKHMCLQAAVWDKEPSRLHAVCAVQANQALVNLTILCPSFRLPGVDLCKGGAQTFVLVRTLHSALKCNILAFANPLGF